MRLATVRHGGSTRAAVIDGDSATLVDARDVGQLMASGPAWRSKLPPTVGEAAVGSLDYAPLVLAPAKIICVGLNYREHIREMGHAAPDCPTLFSKFTRSLIGARDPIRLPGGPADMDFEAELVAVAGTLLRDASPQQAADGICGFTVGNDVTDRLAQHRTTQWLQGKTVEHTTPIGPHLVTTDEVGTEPDLAITCSVDGVVKQSSRTSDMLFTAVEVLAYVSAFITVEPGDLFFLGTPSGVGFGRSPAEYLSDGNVVVTEIETLGRLVNRCETTERGPLSGPDRALTPELAL